MDGGRKKVNAAEPEILSFIISTCSSSLLKPGARFFPQCNLPTDSVVGDSGELQ